MGWKTLPGSGGGGGSALELLHVQDQKASGTAGGTFTSGAWRTRTLNTVVANDITGASLASNRITLPAGTYEIDAHAPGYQCGLHKTLLANITAGTTLLVGSNAYARQDGTADAMTLSHIEGRFTLAASSEIELQHRCSNSRSTDGLGAASSFGVVEVYASVLIRKAS